MTVTKLSDYNLPGGLTDWPAYHAAQVAAGERCRECGASIMWSNGRPSSCFSCCDLGRELTQEVTHEQRIRCPKCREVFRPEDIDWWPGEEGEHTVTCHVCDYSFTVTVHVQYSFVSPPVLSEPEPEPDAIDPD